MDNTKSFWTAHKEFYEAEVLGPMKALLAELEPEFGTGRIFRPYRDTRFSADKSPYKTNIGAHVQTGYISLSSSALGVGSGLYLPSPAQLASYRAAVADGRTGAELVALVDELRGNGIDVMAHDVLKSAPRGVAKDHPRIDLLRHKGLAAWREWPVGAWLSTARTKVRIVEFLRATAPLRAWLDANVDGPEGT
jgi:uncharacterized protein (TIGR02453 family)